MKLLRHAKLLSESVACRRLRVSASGLPLTHTSQLPAGHWINDTDYRDDGRFQLREKLHVDRRPVASQWRDGLWEHLTVGKWRGDKLKSRRRPSPTRS